jgi:hypothetical protein
MVGFVYVKTDASEVAKRETVYAEFAMSASNLARTLIDTMRLF